MDWKTEMVSCGDLVQDGDESRSQEEAERRWNRYVTLADSVTGNEGHDGVATIVRSLKAEEDYGAYQAAHAALARFPAVDLGAGMATAGLLAIPGDHSGNVLLILACAGSVAVEHFDEAVGLLPKNAQDAIRRLVEFHESREWLSEDGRRDVLLMPRSRFTLDGPERDRRRDLVAPVVGSLPDG